MSTATVCLRPAATVADAKQLFEWRNQPFIWLRGSSQKTVTWAEHEAWFGKSMINPDRVIYLVEQAGAPIGMVRFERESAAACVISAYLAQEHIGRGWGVAAIREACKLVFRLWPVGEIRAFVRNDNAYGVQGFAKAGFTYPEALEMEGHAALVLFRGGGR